MPEQDSAEVIQRDLLGNPINRDISKQSPKVEEEQMTVDAWLEAINNPTTEIQIVRADVKPSKKTTSRSRPWEQLVISKGTRDEHSLTGRYYTPPVGVEIWSAPAERRDSFPKLGIEEGNIIFQIKDGDAWENGIRWARTIVLERTAKGEIPKIKGHGYMRWTDIHKL